MSNGRRIMKIMIASDIHGSDFYCEKMLEAFSEEKADKLLLLGDILYHGPRNDLPKDYAPKKVIERLNAIKDDILCVRGNCDTEVDQMVLKFPILADYCIIYSADHHIFFAFCSQIFQQAALLFECTADGLDEPFFGRQRCELRADLKLVVPDGEACPWPIVMLDIDDLYPLFASGPDQFFNIADKLFERIQAFIHDTFLCIHNQ